jgi:hypothetical protein
VFIRVHLWLNALRSAAARRIAQRFACRSTVLIRVGVVGIQANGIVEIGERVLIIVLAQVDVAARVVSTGGFRIKLNGLVQLRERFRKFLGLNECAAARLVLLFAFPQLMPGLSLEQAQAQARGRRGGAVLVA